MLFQRALQKSGFGLLFIFLLSHWLSGSGKLPTEDLSAWNRIGLFGMFIAFTQSVLRWGFFIGGRKLAALPGLAIERMAFAWGLGLIGFMLLPLVLQLLPGALSPPYAWILKTIFILGFFGPKPQSDAIRTNLRALVGRLGITILGFSLILRLYAGLNLQPNGDPLMYHLLGPRLWWDHGGVSEWFHDPIQFLCAGWEALNFWWNAWFAKTPGVGLVEGQILGQWTHSFFGFGGAMLIAPLLARAIDPKLSRLPVFAVAIAAIGSQSLQWTSSLAKNDYGLAAVGIWCFWVLYRYGAEKTALRLVWGTAAIALGLLSFSKINLSLYAAFVALGMIALHSQWRKLPAIILGGILGGAPILLRNALHTGNPVFPWLNQVFKNTLLGPILLEAQEAPFNSATVALERHAPIIRMLHEWTQDHWALYLFLPAVLLSWRWAKKNSKSNHWTVLWTIPSALMVFFAIFFRQATELRYLGPALVLVPVLLLTLIFVSVRERFQAMIALPIALALIAKSQIPLYEIGKLVKGTSFLPKPTSQLVRELPGGILFDYIRQNGAPGEVVIQSGENHTYYLSDYRVRSLIKDPRMSSLAVQARTGEQILTAAREEGARWFLSNTLYLHERGERFTSLLQQIPADRRVFATDETHWVLKLF